MTDDFDDVDDENYKRPLRCTDCKSRHAKGLTGIDEDGSPTCLVCDAVLERVKGA